jgi:hypothetical protein
MPIYLDISRIDRLVVISAHGQVTPEEIAVQLRGLKEADVLHFSKIIDLGLAQYELTKDQIESLATMLRSQAGDKPRGPLAFVIDPKRESFANTFAELTKGDRPVMLFHTIHAARKWLGSLPRV